MMIEDEGLKSIMNKLSTFEVKDNCVWVLGYYETLYVCLMPPNVKFTIKDLGS